MTNVAKLKDTARTLEQKGQWKEALDAYERVVAATEGDEFDVGALNRIGDIHLRLGQPEAAVAAYDRAVTAYVDVGLYNNAIALCKKILRSVPDRNEVYLRLGQISATQGFVADARNNFLQYATAMKRAGNLDASFQALEEFADLSPGDVEVRRLLAEQLETHDRREKAVVQLRLLFSQLRALGKAAEAEEVREKILELDPDAEVSDGAEADPDGEAGPVLEVAGFADVLGGMDEPSATAAELSGLQTNEDFSRLDSIEEDLEDDEPGARLPLLEILPGAGDLDEDEEGAAFPLPTLEPSDAATGFDSGLVDIRPTTDEPDLDEEEDEYGSEPLPMLGFDDQFSAPEEAPAAPRASRAAAPTDDDLPELLRRVREAPDDRDARERVVALLLRGGEEDEARLLLEDAHRALAADGRYVEAADVVHDLIGVRPEDTPPYQKQVEYAFRAGDRSRLIRAYLDLAGHLRVLGNAQKAEAVYQRVLDLDPSNEDARRFVAPSAGAGAPPAAPAAPAPAAPKPAATDDGYVDLGALILDEEESGEKTTRFVVRDEEPTGDEDADFADMLSRFKNKVAENIDAEDSTSHYDLGLAFKDMGLIDEAISQFQVALRGGANPLATLEVLGECFVEKGQYTLAGRVLERALQLDAKDTELIGVYYLLGRCKEVLGQPDVARDYFERVLALDIRFRDAAGRIEAIRAATRG